MTSVHLAFAAGGFLGAMVVLVVSRGPLVPRGAMTAAVEAARLQGVALGSELTAARVVQYAKDRLAQEQEAAREP